jgi:Rap1a immunity proteins
VAARLLPSVVRAFAALFLGVSPAASDFFTGKELQAFCDSPNWDEKNPSVCFGYIIGVASALDGMSVICFSTEVRARQVEDVVKNYLKAHPEKRHDAASALVIAALKEKFPCNQ